MIDLFTIFHRGGAVLYTRELSPVAGRPIDALVQNVLLEERQASKQYRHEDKYTVKWSLANELELVFAAVYLNLSPMLWLEEFLEEVKQRFTDAFRDAIRNVEPSVVYTKKFNRVFDDMLAQYERGGNRAGASAETSAAVAEKRPQHVPGSKKKSADAAESNKEDDSPLSSQQQDSTVPAAAPSGDSTSTDSTSGGVNMAKLAALQQAARSGKPVHSFGKKKKGAAAAAEAAAAPESQKKVKTNRTWNDTKVSKAEAASLDYTAVIDGEAAKGESVNVGFENNAAIIEDMKQRYGHTDKPVYSDDEDEEEDEEDDDEDDAAKPAAGPSGGGFFSYFKTLVAGKVLTRADLEPILAQFKEHLNGKNVAADISEQLAESVIKTLEGQKLASFTSLKSMVTKAIEAALTRILTPNRQIDVLAGVVEANEQQRPYSIVYVGVNGVGKSTSLAKTANYFLTKGLTVGVGACDTFRAGAIEQLRTHTKALNIPLYARGYDRDAAAVAQDAIQQARRDGLNVVLIDTAGRMQHNEPLMRALAKLITLNKPDLVLFVGEALTGNDAVDQVKEFNRALSDMSEEKKPRLIDGIVLTKFDTIDDKVGAAISMAYVTGQPILFVGTGQTYQDLKRLNVKTLIRALMK